MTASRTITLVGAGLAGPLLSVYLARRGFRVEVFERRADMRRTSMSAGRSINLALSTRGIGALERAGIATDILKIAIPMPGRMIHARDGTLTFLPYGKDETEVIHSVSRGGLNVALMDLAESASVQYHFNQRCTGMDFGARQLFFADDRDGATRAIAAERVIATDGAFSAIRLDMQKMPRFNYSQSYLEHSYKELSIPPGPGGSFQLEKHALHIWPRETYMLIALPNLDGSFTCTLFLALMGEPSFASLRTPGDIQAFFAVQFPDALPLMRTLADDFFANPTGDLVTVKCDPWHAGDSALLLGDAAHAVVPFYGQGMNCAFEDCVVLDDCIGRHGDDWNRVFAEFESLRKVNADAIADLAVENFIEMRDLVADAKFLLKKKVEHVLEARHPGKFVPKYSMVTFHRIPYALARSRGQIQDKILDALCSGINFAGDIDLGLADTLLEALPPFPREA